jgi:hypothetical protein
MVNESFMGAGALAAFSSALPYPPGTRNLVKLSPARIEVV